jgi:hypothetical protein
MIVMIPMATGQALAEGVEQSIRAQTLPVEIRIFSTPGLVNSQRHPDRELKNKCEMNSRNAATDWLLKDMRSEKPEAIGFVCMQDRDCFNLQNDNLQYAVGYLQENPDVWIVALPWKKDGHALEDEHTRNICIVARVEALAGYTFKADSKNCSCRMMKKDFKSRYQYLPGPQRVVEIKT